MAKSKPTKIQHYVPKFLLRRFTSSGESIFVFDKQRSNLFCCNIHNIASQEYFYDFESSGEKFTFEYAFGELESKASPLLKDMCKRRSTYIDDRSRAVISAFLAAQLVRTPQRRHDVRGLREDLREEIESRGHDTSKIPELQELSDEQIKMIHLSQILNYDQFIPMFYDKDWILLETTKSNPFWISDNPVSRHNNIDNGLTGNIGLMVEGTQAYLPLSSTLCLAIWCRSIADNFLRAYESYRTLKRIAPGNLDSLPRGEQAEMLVQGLRDGTAVPADPQVIKHQNSLQVAFGSRFIFSSTNDFSLAKRMIADNPQFRTGWRPTVNKVRPNQSK